MGAYDDVHCAADLPPGHPPGQRDFQTKSLFRCADRMTITKEGRLVFHPPRYVTPQSREESSQFETNTPDVMDLDFHGDIRLTCTVEDRLVEYAARFSHGKLEWIRPWTELSEIHKALLTSW